MPELLDSEAYLQRFFSAPKPGTEKMLLFYDHRVGAFTDDPRFLVAPMYDHLVCRGDGLFEALKFIDRRLYQLDAHLKRMQRCAQSIHLTPPCTWERMRELAIEMGRLTTPPNGILRFFLGRGPGGFGVDPSECVFSSLYLVIYKLTPRPEELFKKGVTAFRSSTPAKQSYLAKIKSTNYLPNALIKREANERGYDFGFCFDEQDYLAEGSIENVCLVDQSGTLVVPEFTNSLMGTTLMRGLDLIKDEIRVQIRRVREDEIYHARELMVVGTTLDCLSIVRYNDKPIHDVRPGPVSKRMRELIQKDIVENGVEI